MNIKVNSFITYGTYILNNMVHLLFKDKRLKVIHENVLYLENTVSLSLYRATTYGENCIYRILVCSTVKHELCISVIF